MKSPQELFAEAADVARQFEHAAEIMWSWYYVATEEFDRRLPGIPSRWDPGVWLPMPEERRYSDAFAATLRGIILPRFGHLPRHMQSWSQKTHEDNWARALSAAEVKP